MSGGLPVKYHERKNQIMYSGNQLIETKIKNINRNNPKKIGWIVL
jgi:hypothetical protein